MIHETGSIGPYANYNGISSVGTDGHTTCIRLFNHGTYALIQQIRPYNWPGQNPLVLHWLRHQGLGHAAFSVEIECMLSS